MGRPLAILLSLLVVTICYLESVPLRGDVEWVMLLCKYRGSDFIPRVRDWYVNWLTNETANGSIAYFFRHASNGVYTVRRSKVHGWFEIPYTRLEVIDLGNNDELLRDEVDKNQRIYVKTKQLCHEYATGVLKISIPDSRRVITAINAEDTAVFCLAFGVLVTPRFAVTSAIAHEMSHSFDLGHSYSDMQIKVFSHAESGEYDDRYDIMSTANAYMYTSGEFGPVGPGFNGPNLDYLGWLPEYRMYFFGKLDSDKEAPETLIRVSSLSRPHEKTSDWLLILIPYDKDDPLKVYTVELRTREFLDVAIPKAAVVIHQVDRRDNGVFLYSKVLNQGGEKPNYELLEGGEWKVALSGEFRSRFIRVKVNWIDEQSATAEIAVSSDFSPTACSKSEVQRAAFEFDVPCVSVRQREDVRRQNNRNLVSPLGKNGECIGGLVYRKAGPDDNVCVTESERDAVEKQNQRWRKYTNFYSNPTFGLNSCREGYVWRLIDPYDFVCIDKSRAHEWEKQNEEHRSRLAAIDISPSNQCRDGSVWRQAVQDDEICVSTEERLQAQGDNAKRAGTLLYTRFFNADSKLVP